MKSIYLFLMFFSRVQFFVSAFGSTGFSGRYCKFYFESKAVFLVTLTRNVAGFCSTKTTDIRLGK